MNRKFLLLIITQYTVWSTQVFAQLPPGESMLPAGISALSCNRQDSVFTKTTEIGENKIIEVNLLARNNEGNLIMSSLISTDVSKGDVLWLSFKSRTIISKKETGEAFVQFSIDRTTNGVYEWPPLLERSVSFGKDWVFTAIPFIASRDAKANTFSFVLKCGNGGQQFQLKSLQLINYHQNVKYGDLPKSVVHYDGDDINATWRKQAEARIEKYRKGELTLKVVDRFNKPIQGAKVTARMKKIYFGWGTAVNSKILLDTEDLNAKIYRRVLLKYFNKVVFENELKSGNWDKADHEKTLRAVDFLKKNKIDIRGHVMVWPSFQHSPHLANFKTDTMALKQAIFRLIKEQAAMFGGLLNEWDVVNEPYAHHDILDLLGRKAMVDWFKAAKTGAPHPLLFLNDYTMFQGSGPGSPSESFYNNVSFLKLNGAPVEAIGEQAHIGGVPPGIPYVISRLDHFAELGLPIQISEFDITSDDDDFKQKYIRDFTTALFSHPAVIGFVQWGFWESQHWVPTAALWDKNWVLKPEGIAFTDLVSKVFVTNTDGATGAEGKFSIRGYKGVYEITVIKGKRKTVSLVKIAGTHREHVVKL